MPEQANMGHEVIMAGLGGGGVLTIGRILGVAAMAEFQHVLWNPSYSMASRGGPCECSVMFSNEEIHSHLLDQAQVIIALHPSQLKPFEGRVRPGGIMIAEQKGLRERLERSDVRLVQVAAVDAAINVLGGVQGSNLVLLGAYVGLVKSVPPARIEEVIENRFKERAAARDSNLTAFRAGLSIAASLASVATPA